MKIKKKLIWTKKKYNFYTNAITIKNKITIQIYYNKLMEFLLNILKTIIYKKLNLSKYYKR